MPQIVVAPNGDEVEFPDGTPDDQIVQVMKREYAPAQPVIRATPVEGGSFQAGGLNGPSVVPAGSTPDPQTAQDPTRLKTLANTINQGLYGGASGLARIFQSAIPETATSPLDVSVRKGLGYFAEETDKSAQQIQEGFNVNPAAKDIPSQIARGAGTVATALPFGVAGIGQLGASVYNQAFNKAVSEGKSDTEARNEAAVHLEKEVPKLAAFAVGGKVASALVGKIASPLVRGLAGTAVGTAVNTTVGSAAKALEGEDWRPNAESLTMDALFGLVHGFGEHANATAEVRQRAADELKARGIPEEAVAPAVEPSEAQGRSVPQSEVKTPPSEQATPSTAIPEVVVPEAQVKVTPEGITDLQTGEPISPIREQSLKSLGVIPEVRTETALEPMERDAFERTSGETLEEGNVAYRDPQTRQVFQAPEKATPEELKGIVDAARLEEESAQRRARLEEHDIQVEEARLAKSREEVGQVPVPKAVEVQQNDYLWNNPLRLKNLRDEMVMQDKKAKAGTLSIGGEKVKPNPRFESTLKEIDSRIQFLMSPEALEEAPRTLTPLTVRAEEPVQPSERAQTPLPEVSGRQVEPEPIPTPEKPQADPEAVVPLPTEPPPGIDPSAFERDPVFPLALKNESIDKVLEGLGLPPAMKLEAQTRGQVWEDAMRKMAEDPQYQDRLIDSLKKDRTRPVTVEDQAIVRHRWIEKNAQLDQELSKLRKAIEEGDQAQVVESIDRQASLQKDIQQLGQIGTDIGSVAGKTLQARQNEYNEDFSPSRLIGRRIAAKGGPIPAEEALKIQQQSERIAELEKELVAARAKDEAKASDAHADEVVKRVVHRVRKEGQPKGNIEKANEWLKSRADQARERIRARREQGQAFSGGVNPEEIDDYIIIGASKLAEGISNAAKWSSEMVAEFGESIRPYLKALFEKSKAAHADAPKQFTNEEQRTRILDGLKARVAEGDSVEKLGSYIHKLAENAVRGGIKERVPLVKAVHQVVSEIIPNITEREVQDAISGYGKFRPLSTDPDKTILRDLSGQLQQVSKIQDILKKLAPKKTGSERRTPSAEERRLVKEVNDLKKKAGYTVTDPATQLRTALQAQERGLSNAIRDIGEEIATGQPRTPRGASPTNDRIEMLKALLERLKQTREEVFGTRNRELTDEQRLKAAVEAANRTADEYERQVREEDFAKKKGKPLMASEDLEKARARRDSAKAERDELKLLDQAITGEGERLRNERYLAAIKKNALRKIEDLKSRLARKDFTPPPARRKTVLDADATKLLIEKQKIITEYERENRKVELANRSKTEKLVDAVHKWKRAAVLSGYSTILKLTSAAGEIVGFTPIEQLVGAGIARLPGMKSIREGAERRGQFSPSIETKALMGTLKRIFSDPVEYLKSGQLDIDTLFEKPHYEPFELKELFGRVHGALKTPARRNEWIRSFEYRMKHAEEIGLDVNDPVVQAKAGLDAYRDANSAILMNDNIISNGVSRMLSGFMQRQKDTGQPTMAGRLANAAFRFQFPILRIPLNFVARVFEYGPVGVAIGAARLVRVFKKGAMNATPEQRDLIIKNLARGSLGTAVMAIGFFNPQMFGGYYEGDKRDKKDVKYGRAKIGGVEIPSVLLHNPLLEAAQIGATIRRVMDSKHKKSDAQTQGLGAGVLAAALGVVEEVPFLNEATRVAKILNPHERQNAIGEYAKGQIPQVIQQIASKMDKDPTTGETTRRKPRNFGEHLKLGIPGLRKQVPLKREGSSSGDFFSKQKKDDFFAK